MSGVAVRTAISSAEKMRQLAAGIAHASAEEAKALHDRVGVAREWAKLQQDAENLLDELRFLEARILGRIGALGAERDVLPPCYRKAARHYSTLDDADLSRFLNDHRSSTALGSYQRFTQQQETDRIVKKARRSVTNRIEDKEFADLDDDDAHELRQAARHLTSVRTAAAVILDEYASYKTRFTTSEVVDEFIYDNPLDEAETWQQDAFRKGLREAFRHTLMQAPVETTDRSGWIPRFITVYEASADLWTRIPSEFATVGDARRMVEARTAQIVAMQRAVDNLSRHINAKSQDDDWFRDDTTAVTARLRMQSEQAS